MTCQKTHVLEQTRVFHRTCALQVLWNVTNVIDDSVTDAVWAEASGNYFYGPNTFETTTANKITIQFSV